MSWKGKQAEFETDNNSDAANLPDYQKMLQSHRISSGWDSSVKSSSADKFRLNNYTISNSSTISPPLNTRSHSRPSDSFSDRGYQTYQPSRYGMTFDNKYEESFTNRDFAPLNPEDTAHVINSDGLEKTVSYGNNNYEYKSDLKNNYRKYSADPYSGKSSSAKEFDLERPNLNLNEPQWTSTSNYQPVLRRGRNASSSVLLDSFKSKTDISGRPPRPVMDDIYAEKNRHFNENGEASYSAKPLRPRSMVEFNFHDGYSSETGISSQTPKLRANSRSDMYKMNSSQNLYPMTSNRSQSPKPNSDHSDYNTKSNNAHDYGEARYDQEGGITSKPSVPNSSGLTNWQKFHQDQIIHKPSVRENSPHTLSKTGGFDQLFRQLADGDDSPNKWSSVKRAADAIISERDMVIDKLKMQIAQLEEDNKRYETKLRVALINNKDQQNGGTFSLLKELEMENADLKDQLKNNRSGNKQEMEDLEIKLGATEQEVLELRAALRKRVPEYEMDMQTKIDQLEDEKEEWKDKCLEMTEANHELNKKLEEVQRYLSDLPTLDEADRMEQDLATLQEKDHHQTDTIEELNAQLMETRKLLSTREMQIEELETKGKDLSQCVGKLQDEIDDFKSIGHGAALHQRENEIQRLMQENKKLNSDLEKAKKLLETGHKKVRQQELKQQHSLRQFEERLSQEEEMVTALREEVRAREEHLNKMKKSCKQLQTQNQDMMEQNLVLREKVKKMEQQCTEENTQVHKQFIKEMTLCYTELQTLVQICVQRAEGQDPNMSLLLGVSTSDEVEQAASSGLLHLDTLEQWLSKLKELREEISALRGLVCNKYAEDMGDNLNCTTQ